MECLNQPANTPNINDYNNLVLIKEDHVVFRITLKLAIFYKYLLDFLNPKRRLPFVRPSLTSLPKLYEKKERKQLNEKLCQNLYEIAIEFSYICNITRCFLSPRGGEYYKPLFYY